ncbi:MAG: hypothetical protein WHS87_03735 [Anaerolineales bacterium]
MSELPQVVNLHQTNVAQVAAEMVRASQCGVQELRAAEVDMRQTAVQQAHADHLKAHQSAIFSLRAGDASLEQCSLAYAQSGTLSLTSTRALVLRGGRVQANDARVGVLLAEHVEGNVQVLFSRREALIIGLLAGLLSGVFYLLGRAFFRKS